MCPWPMFTLYYKRTLQGDVCQLSPADPVYPVFIIGYVRGACQMLPDPDWKDEERLEARARTSGSNNNDDQDQGGDIPSWMFK